NLKITPDWGHFLWFLYPLSNTRYFSFSLRHLQFASVYGGLGARFHFDVVLRMMGYQNQHRPLAEGRFCF
ncbi:MAG: hypothetical protein K5651_00360, partial [Bacteroidales bacterium]|nr:hypothetical protein [Bacteroidales bacterium]